MKTLFLIITLIASTAQARGKCGNDYGCGFGETCVGASNPYAYDGRCMKKADTSNPYQRPNTVIQTTCSSDYDCQSGNCEIAPGSMWGVCQ